MKEITFNSVEHTTETLTAMTVEALLELRNEIADALGVAKIQGFKDQATGVAQTVKALERFASQSEEPKAKKTPKAPKEKKERGLAKSAEAKTVKRPTLAMFATIKKIGEHDGTQGRGHRWANYKDGMTIVDIIETEGTEPWDVYNWEKFGILSVTKPTEEEFLAAKAAWYTKHGLTDPEAAKVEKAAERAKLKAEREAAAAVKKAEREAAKEAKAKVAAEKKAEAEKAKAAKAAKAEEAKVA